MEIWWLEGLGGGVGSFPLIRDETAEEWGTEVLLEIWWLERLEGAGSFPLIRDEAAEEWGAEVLLEIWLLEGLEGELVPSHSLT